MEEYEQKDDKVMQDREEIFSKVVRAGKRTYFFDVKATRKDDYYLTITESKKVFDKDGRFHFEKHKLFLYKEDFEKFEEGLVDAIGYIKKVKGDHSTEYSSTPRTENREQTTANEFSNVEFEDLDGEN